MALPAIDNKERRRVERRTNARLTDLTVPELRRMLVTSLLFAVVLILFLWMVRTVIIAGFLGAVVAAYLRPVYHWFRDRLRSPGLAAIVAILFLIGPLIALLVWSYTEIARFKVVEKNFGTGDTLCTHLLQYQFAARRESTIGFWHVVEQVTQAFQRITEFVGL